ncbi:MAG: histidine phosphatase family protein [Bernardetiaceae bacterium]
MKKLLIARHARTEEAGKDDAHRTLSETGITDTREMGQKLKAKHIKVDKIYSSHLRRAVATAQILGQVLNFPQENIEEIAPDYHSSPEELLAFVQQLDDALDTVLIVNHNTPVTHLVDLLTNTTQEMLNPSCVAEVDFEIEHWSEVVAGKGKLIKIEHPSFDHY